MAQQTADNPTERATNPRADNSRADNSRADQALGQALSALADAGRSGRDGGRLIAVQVGRRVGMAGGRAGRRAAGATTDAARRLGDAYVALRGPEPHLWRSRHVIALVLAGVATGVGLSYAHARRVSLQREVGSEAGE